jgi:hypothetical protein
LKRHSKNVKRGLQVLRQATEIDLSRDADQIYKEKEDWRFRDFFRLRFSAHTHFFDRDMVDNGGRWGQRTGDRAQRLRGGTIQR